MSDQQERSSRTSRTAQARRAAGAARARRAHERAMAAQERSRALWQGSAAQARLQVPAQSRAPGTIDLRQAADEPDRVPVRER